MEELAAMRPKIHSNLTDINDENKKAKGTKMYVMKTKLKFRDYKNRLEATQLENKINELEKTKLNLNSLRKNHK